MADKAEIVNKDLVMNIGDMIDSSDENAGDEEIQDEQPIDTTAIEPKAETVPEKQEVNLDKTIEPPIETTPKSDDTTELNEDDSAFNIKDLGDVNKDITPQDNSVDKNSETDKNIGNWKDVIKKVDYKEVAKELGLDDFIIELNEHIKNGGNAQDYIFAKTFDWDKVPDELLLKDTLQRENPSLTKEQVDKVFNKKYSQNEFDDEDDKELGDIMKKMDADKLRTSKKEEQKKFVLPDPKEVQLPEDVKEKLSNIEKFITEGEKTKTHILNSDATKNLQIGKRVAVDLPDGTKFNFFIDKPDDLTNILTNGDLWHKITRDDKGEPNVSLLQKVAMLALDEKKFIGDIYNRGKDAGKNELVAENRNAGKPTKVLPSAKNEKVVVGGDVTISL